MANSLPRALLLVGVSGKGLGWIGSTRSIHVLSAGEDLLEDSTCSRLSRSALQEIQECERGRCSGSDKRSIFFIYRERGPKTQARALDSDSRDDPSLPNLRAKNPPKIPRAIALPAVRCQKR